MSEPKRTGLLELLRASQGCQFVIPVYQRNYTWVADEQVKQYLMDLENVLKGDYKNHFLGIVIYLEKSIDFSTREFSVIDGQQRLTTTFLMIYAVKEILENAGDIDKVKQIEGQFLTNPYSADNVKYKLKPLVSDDNVYRCIVENRMDEIDEPNSNVLKNFKYISDKLNQWLLSGYDANQILMAMDKLYVVCVPISDEDNAQKIFESINATGAKLTAADLIRNYLLMDLQSDIQEEYYAKYWRKIEDNVSQDSKKLEMFFRMVLAVKTYTLVPRNSVYREFMNWVGSNKLEIKPLFEELLDYAKIYNYLIESKLSDINCKTLRTAIKDFRRIDSDLPMSIIMEFCKLYRLNEISDEILGAAIASVNAYLLRRSICDMNSQNISKLFPTILRKVLEKCDSDFKNMVQVLNQEMVGNNAATSGSYMPTDKQMHEALHLANVYKRPALRIVLDRIELENNPAPVDLSALSVEHLMPQTPSEEWLEELDTDMETYQDNIHRLGNLTLATKPDNSKMGNATWNYKNEVLKDTAHLTMNVELMAIERWDLEQIEARTIKMIDKICELYPYPTVKIIDAEVDIVDENVAVGKAIKILAEKEEVTKKGNSYYSADGVGYVVSVSKMYPQGDKEKYWFGYREKRFEALVECTRKELILVCRYKDVMVVRLPEEFLVQYKERFNVSVDEEGNVKHYHVVIFKNPDGRVTMLLSHPSLKEIDISEYVIG